MSDSETSEQAVSPSKKKEKKTGSKTKNKIVINVSGRDQLMQIVSIQSSVKLQNTLAGRGRPLQKQWIGMYAGLIMQFSLKLSPKWSFIKRSTIFQVCTIWPGKICWAAG